MATEVPTLAGWSASEKMVGEYRALGLYPRGHLMAFVRPTLPPDVRPAATVMQEKYEVCCGLLHGFDWSAWTGSPAQRLELLPGCCRMIMTGWQRRLPMSLVPMPLQPA